MWNDQKNSRGTTDNLEEKQIMMHKTFFSLFSISDKIFMGSDYVINTAGV